MKITTLSLGPYGANCYVVETDNSAVIIDPGFLDVSLKNHIEEKRNKIRAVLLTHVHFDHIGAVSYILNLLNIPVYIHYEDRSGLYDNAKNLSYASQGLYNIQPLGNEGVLHLSDNQVLLFDDLKITVLHTPGHSEGSVCFLVNEYLFSGDTLFNFSIGRTDFPSSDTKKMIASLKRLCKLDDKTIVLPGHGEKTTLGFEKKNNIFLAGNYDIIDS